MRGTRSNEGVMAAMVSPAHSPRRLERLAKERLVYLVIRHSIPASISMLTFPQDLGECSVHRFREQDIQFLRELVILKVAH